MTKKTTAKITKEKFDYTKITDLAKTFCTKEEIADLLELCLEELEADEQFLKLYRRSVAEAKAILRKKQLEMADKNATMTVWLGRVFLGQKERAEAPDKELDYDVTKLPDFYLHRIIKGEDPVKVINEFENVTSAN